MKCSTTATGSISLLNPPRDWLIGIATAVECAAPSVLSMIGLKGGSLPTRRLASLHESARAGFPDFGDVISKSACMRSRMSSKPSLKNCLASLRSSHSINTSGSSPVLALWTARGKADRAPSSDEDEGKDGRGDRRRRLRSHRGPARPPPLEGSELWNIESGVVRNPRARVTGGDER